MLQASEIVLYILVSLNLGLCLVLTSVIYFVCREIRQKIQGLEVEHSNSTIDMLDLKSELSLKYDEQLAALAKGHNELVAQLHECSAKIASLNATVQGGRLNATKASQTSSVPSIFPGRF